MLQKSSHALSICLATLGGLMISYWSAISVNDDCNELVLESGVLLT